MAKLLETRFLTQEEVAGLLRKSVQAVARLRKSGELAWLPGSPILIEESEVSAYLERRIVRREQVASKPTSTQLDDRRIKEFIARQKRLGRLESLLAARALARPAKRNKL